MSQAAALSSWLVMRDPDNSADVPCAGSRFSLVVHPPGFVVDNMAVLASGTGVQSFQFMASLSRRALLSICLSFEFPVNMLPSGKGELASLCEVLVRNYARNGREYVRTHYYALWCDSRNRSLWRACVRDDCSLPLYFSSLVGFRVKFSSYPARLFECTREYQEYYCAYLRGFMRLVADYVGWRGGWICSRDDDEFWNLCPEDSDTVMGERELFSQIAQESVSRCPPGWCPDVFEGLGAHTDPLWFCRPPGRPPPPGCCSSTAYIFVNV